MPVYRKDRSRDRWAVRIYHRGRPHEWIVRGTKADAAAFEARKRVELATQDPATVSRVVPTFSVFCAEKYRPHAELHLKPSWWAKQQYVLATLNETFEDARLSEIDAAAVEKYARSRLHAGLKASSVNNELRVLKRVMNFARERGYAVPAPSWTPLRESGAGAVKAWTHDELALLLDVAELGDVELRRREGKGAKPQLPDGDPEILPLLVFLANTGARAGEALALTWDHVDLERRLIKIWPSPEWQPKNGRPREVPISDALLPWLEAEPRPSTKWVFASSRKDAAGDRRRFAFWPQKRFDRLRRAAGLKGGPHTLRHTFATHFLEQCPDLFLLARILGHSEIAVTRRYAHLLPDHLARARNAVNVAAGVGPATLEARRRWKQTS